MELRLYGCDDERFCNETAAATTGTAADNRKGIVTNNDGKGTVTTNDNKGNVMI